MNKKLTKVVNIYPTTPIIGVNPPIRSAVKRVTKPINDIRICLMSRAIVEEILPNGDVVKLNIGNYDKYLGPDKEVTPTCGCGCGSGTCGWKITETSNEPKVEKTPWEIAYDKALEGVNLTSMTRKQRRAALDSAKAAANAAVKNNEQEEVVMGVMTIESTEPVEDNTEEVVTEVAEEVKDEEEVVVTNDAEDLTNIVE